MAASMTLPKFQSTPPARAATATMDSWYMRSPVSIHAAREGGDGLHAQAAAFQSVSIHAAREGGDSAQCPHHTQAGCFNPRRPRGRRQQHIRLGVTVLAVSIHAAREGGDARTLRAPITNTLFQSTPPARAATIHPCAGLLTVAFQSTPPARAATQIESALCVKDAVSIHAAREGGDRQVASFVHFTLCFNPRRPRGRRHRGLHYRSVDDMFQSTPPARAATKATVDKEKVA